MEFKDEASLIEHLRVVDSPCIGCGYSMRGLGGLTCPECGRRFVVADLGRPVRPRWAALMVSGWGWWLCVLLCGAAFVWEAAVEVGLPGWYRLVFQGRHGGGLVPVGAAMLLIAWPMLRFRASGRAGAEMLLWTAWALVVVQLCALSVQSVL
ncbi:MAG TPA: hypothetical protein VD997_16395 [Phycisphaerales bacterium]|nr:hypothetical protein [Phycisphaerales bacterium]